MRGWIKLHRKLQGSAMYKALNSTQRDVMIQCLLMANHAKEEWYWGNTLHVCEPGQFITSLENIRKKCAKGTSIKNVRTSLVKLEKMIFLANKSAKTGRLITIINWETYQGEECDDGKDIGKRPADDRQTTGKEVATNKNVKNVKNEKKETSQQAIKIAQSLFEYLKGIKPDRKDVRSSSIRALWAPSVDAMHLIDGRTWVQIEAVLKWLFVSYRPNGRFDWRNNIKSGKKLRDKFDQLELEMTQQRGKSAATTGHLAPVNYEGMYD